MAQPSANTIFLFTDIEGSSQLWEEQPLAMRVALAWHDQALRQIVLAHTGEIVKRTGDGIHAAFTDALAALRAGAAIQRCMLTPPATVTTALALRCGLHCGYDEQRDGDYFGTDVNRAARVMSVAHGGQVLMSEAVQDQVRWRLPSEWALKALGASRLRGFAQAERLFQLCAPGLRADFAAVHGVQSPPHNLPATSTRFFNRVRELRQLEQLLPAERLVLLHGLGGMGKTRLALEAARAAADHFEDGVWFVELSKTNDPAMVPHAVASVLGIKEEAGSALSDTLARTLAPRRMLLVLDNCEQVIAACAQLTDTLLARVPGLHLLVTSREHLRLTAERIVDVGGLELPGERGAGGAGGVGEAHGASAASRIMATGKANDLEQLAQSSAVALFVDRIKAVAPDFELSAESAGPIRAICRQLDGIPLALELAAASARRLPLALLATRLEDRLGTLVHGQRVASDRQKTLRGLIDWSYELLDAQQQQVFQALSVFAGGWTVPDAEAVCASQVLGPDQVVERLGELVEKSLVLLDLLSGRYRMLDTVRQYAQERLAAGAEALAVQARHLEVYLALAEQARPHLGGAEQKGWLEQLDIERDNILAAHQSCARLPQGAVRGVRLSWAIKPYWLNRGLLGLGLRVATEALERLPTGQAQAERCAALADAGQLCFYVGQYAHAQRYLRRCIALCRELGEERLEAAALQPLGMACLALGQADQAQEHLKSARALAVKLKNLSFQGYVDSAIAQVHRVNGQYAEALLATRAAHATAESLGDHDLVAISQLNEAMTLVSQQGSHAARPAIALMDQALGVCADNRSQQLIQSVLELATGLACVCGRWDEAAEFWSWAEAMARHSGLKRDPADESFVGPHVKLLEQQLGAANLRHRMTGAELQPDLAVISRLQSWTAQLRGEIGATQRVS